MNSVNILFQDADGFKLDLQDYQLTATDDNGNSVSLPIFRSGLTHLGNAMLVLAADQEQKVCAMRTGRLIGQGLVNELQALPGDCEYEAFLAVQDKLNALSKLQRFDSAAEGFAFAVVKALRVGIANFSDSSGRSTK